MTNIIINGKEYNVVTRKRNIKKVTLTFFSDPGHGWLKVPKRILSLLEKQQPVINLISEYSYERGDFVYLEEDCDANKVLDRLSRHGVDVKINHRHANRSSKIRSYNRFSAWEVV